MQYVRWAKSLRADGYGAEIFKEDVTCDRINFSKILAAIVIQTVGHDLEEFFLGTRAIAVTLQQSRILLIFTYRLNRSEK